MRVLSKKKKTAFVVFRLHVRGKCKVTQCKPSGKNS